MSGGYDGEGALEALRKIQITKKETFIPRKNTGGVLNRKPLPPAPPEEEEEEELVPTTPPRGRRRYNLWNAVWFGWGIVLTFLLVGSYWRATPPQAILIGGTERSKWSFGFDIPADAKRFQFLNLSIPGLNFANLVRYDVCCFLKDTFLCRSSVMMKNLGVECIVKGQTVVVFILHSDMAGAKCHFLWAEKK